MKFFTRLTALFAALTLCTVQVNALSLTAEPILTCTTADEWNALFDRTGKSNSTWLGADGIFSVSLDGNDSFASADENTKTAFFFSDTLMGASDSNGKVISGWAMPSHTSAILTGNTPDADNMEFIYGNGGNMTVGEHLFGERKWLLDCFVTGDNLYVLGFSPSGDWKPENIDMWTIPIENGEPVYSRYSKTPDISELWYRTADDSFLYAYGIGVTITDGYIYIYGYRDAMKEGSRKDLIVSRIKDSDFPDFSKISYWNGTEWCDDILKSEPILKAVSCEMSVTPVTSGPYAGKYIAVYTNNTQSEEIMYSIGDSLVGPFATPIKFYETPEHNEKSASGNGKLYTYNAKAHPHLSSDGKLLVSYNCNVSNGGEQYSVDYHPRFLWLDLGQSAEAAQISDAAPKTSDNHSAVSDVPSESTKVIIIIAVLVVIGAVITVIKKASKH